jgi:hypothetical protein
VSTAALIVLGFVGGVLGTVAFGPALAGWLRARREAAAAATRAKPFPKHFDPGRELRAERKARELLRSVVAEHEYAMYEELGFLRMRPDHGDRPASYAYLIYAHRPIVAYELSTGRALSEYCIDFPDVAETELGTRLPDADDVLAKWMSLRSNEAEFLATANLHQPGRQIDPAKVRGDIRRAERWMRAWTARHGGITPETELQA